MIAYKKDGVAAPDLSLWNQSLARATRELGDDHPKLWIYTRDLYKKSGGREVPGLNANVDAKIIPFPAGKPNYSTVEKVLRAMSNENHYLMTKPLKLWDEYDMANWRVLLKKYQGHGPAAVGASGSVTKKDADPLVQLGKGIEHEKEHEEALAGIIRVARDTTQSEARLIHAAVRLIAEDHLREIPDYYDRLAMMESKALQGQGEVGAQPTYTVAFRKDHQVGYGFEAGWAVLDEEGFVVNGDADSFEAGYKALIFDTEKKAQQALKEVASGRIKVYLPASERGIQALANMADLDEQRIRVAGRVGAEGDVPWYPDEWQG